MKRFWGAYGPTLRRCGGRPPRGLTNRRRPISSFEAGALRDVSVDNLVVCGEAIERATDSRSSRPDGTRCSGITPRRDFEEARSVWTSPFRATLSRILYVGRRPQPEASHFRSGDDDRASPGIGKGATTRAHGTRSITSRPTRRATSIRRNVPGPALQRFLYKGWRPAGESSKAVVWPTRRVGSR